MSTLVVGVDPGLTTGLLAVLFDRDHRLAGNPIAVQIHGHQGVVPFVEALLERAGCDDRAPLVAVEQFVIGARAVHNQHHQAGRVTRDLIGALKELDAHGAQVVVRPAATVKPWANANRMTAAGLIEPTEGMRHARDAARHALYAAVHARIAVDPLSSAATTRDALTGSPVRLWAVR